MMATEEGRRIRAGEGAGSLEGPLRVKAYARVAADAGDRIAQGAPGIGVCGPAGIESP